MNTHQQGTTENLPLFPHDLREGMREGLQEGIREEKVWEDVQRDLPRDLRRDHDVKDSRRVRAGRTVTDRGSRSINPHLLAARKLSKKIKYLPDHSEAQSETARAICQHLRLLLAATDRTD